MLDRQTAVMVLWLSTAIIAVAQAAQVRHVLRVRDAGGVSLASEAINLGAALGLTVYAFTLGDAPLIVSRCLLLALWALRLGVALWIGRSVAMLGGAT